MREPDYEKALDTILPRPKPEPRPKKPAKPKARVGRLPVPVEKRRKPISFSLPPDAIKALENERSRRRGSSVRGMYPMSQVVEDLIREVLLNDERASLAGQVARLSEELAAFYDIAREAKAVWGRSTSGLPAPVDRVMERLTKRYNTMQRAQGAEPEPMPWEEQDSTDYVL